MIKMDDEQADARRNPVCTEPESVKSGVTLGEIREELKNGASPRDWTMESIPGRLKDKKDPWKGIVRHGQSIKKRGYRLRELMDREKPAQGEQD